ncbi:MAG: Ku protein [Chitinophagaceae bacterium]|nr:Ku protein [Chitinophagaceae bacterium]
MKSIWTGSIAFGLVNIPVKLFSAVNERTLDFDMLDKTGNAHIKFKRVNKKTGKEVPWKNIVKGFNINGKYVVLEDKDFEKASPKQTKNISLESFVTLDQVDPILYKSAYYLNPAKGGERPFALLEKSISQSKYAGIGRFVFRNKEHPVLIRSAKGVLILHTLHFISEIRNPAAYQVKSTPVQKKELAIAHSLIQNMEGTFKITDFKDTYTAKLMQLIRAKALGKKLPEPKKAMAEAPVSDLFEQLRLSLEGKKKRKPAAKKTARSKTAVKRTR